MVNTGRKNLMSIALGTRRIDPSFQSQTMVLKYGKITFHSNFLIRGQKPTVSAFGKFGKKK